MEQDLRFASGREATAADELFVNLDGTVLNVGNVAWRVEICGVHSYGRRNWIQLNLVANDCNYGLTIGTERLSPVSVRAQLLGWLKTSPQFFSLSRIASA